MSKMLEFLKKATTDGTVNALMRDVIGNKSDAAATVGTTKSIMANVKQVTNQGQKLDSAAIATSTLTAGSLASLLPRCIEKSDGAVLSGADDLFTITGGPVIGMVVGVVTTIIGGAANGTLQITTTAPAGTTSLSTTVAIDSDAVGTSYRFVGATGVLTPITAGAVIIDPVTVDDCRFLLPIGTVSFLGSAARTGNIKWYMHYIPLSPNSLVVAAA